MSARCRATNHYLSAQSNTHLLPQGKILATKTDGKRSIRSLINHIFS
jgi:hypothetical protein